MNEFLPNRRWTADPWIPLWLSLWGILVATALLTRPPLPMDETRYLAVAWEMWQGGHFMVPHLNGLPYSDKPPLLFWLMHLGWAIFGVNEWTPRLVAPLAGLISVALTAALARRLWPQPDDEAIGRLAPLILIGSLFWTLFGTLTMFDMLLAACALLALHGVITAWRRGGWAGWIVVGIGIGLGVLAKGPAILLHVLPVALLAPLWGPRLAGPRAEPLRWRRWYGGLGVAVLLGAAIGLAWAIPAAWIGGGDYARAIFWGQSAGRMVDSFAHREPWWLYLATLPALILPWPLWRPLWRAVGRLVRRPMRLREDGGLLLCLSWLLPAVVAFSAISGKQLHYLLPEYPAIALGVAFAVVRVAAERPPRSRDGLVAAGLFVAIGGALAIAALPFVPLPRGLGDAAPVWGLLLLAAGAAAIRWRPTGLTAQAAVLTALSALAVVTIHLIARPVLQEAYDLRPVSQAIAKLEAEGHPLANYGKYRGQYDFLGRLQRPITVLGPDTVDAWVADHPDGILIFHQKSLPPDIEPLFHQPFRLTVVAIWDAKTIAEHPQILDRRR